ncbi:hypothetical protein Ndes2526A_g06520 [Nannochloris sp. 'desiccata']|nr:hypothetical protein KSW81_008322 [Chlorella desiccata (nom. nud.)]
MPAAEEQVVINSTSSWWHNPSVLNDPKNPLAPAVPTPPKEQPYAPVGGARAQCRFAGRTAKPIFSSPPLSGAPKINSSSWKQETPAAEGDNSHFNNPKQCDDRKRWVLPMQGQTCDGTRPQNVNPSCSSASPTASRWKFNLDSWTWEVADDEDAGPRLAAQYGIAARRWGDGRDTLGPATRQQTTHSIVDAAMNCDTSSDGNAAKRQKSLQINSTVTVIHNNNTTPTTKDIQSRGFASVGGFDRQKEILKREILTPLRHPKLCKQLGLLGSRGVLLSGPPGCGKTYLARALGEESTLHVESINGADCVGGKTGEERLRRAFNAAKNAAPCILFIDEIDALAPARGMAGVSDTERQSTALTLSLFDNLRKSGAVVALVAASNRPDAIDPALRRPGRLDTEIGLGPPGTQEREAILRCAVGSTMPLESSVQLENIAGKLQGYMAADVAAVVTEAALRCVVEAVSIAEENDTLEQLINQGETTSVENKMIVVGNHHFNSAIEAMAPAILRGIAAEIPRDVAWDDVGGLDSVKKELQELVEWPLVHGDKLAAMGLPLPAGALLYGPPGCGKTLLAKAVAGCCGANFISVRGPELLQKWLGESEKAIRDVFTAARAAAPCVVFFDEVDAVAPRRDGAGSSSSSGGGAAGDAAASRVLNQLLCELDGIGSRTGNSPVFILAATNRPAAIDPALLRPGRLDRVLKVPLPDEQARSRILTAALRKCPLAAELDLTAFAAGEELEGFSGADMSELARRAGTYLVRQEIAASEALTNEIINSERKEEEAKHGASSFFCLETYHLYAALHGMRRSVSISEAEYHDKVERKLAEGSLSAADVFGQEAAAQRQQQNAKQMQAVVQAVERACENKAVELRARVEQLEAAMLEAGLELPEVSVGQATGGEGSTYAQAAGVVD